MKGKPLTKEEFENRAHALYGSKYIYTKVDLEHRDEKGRVCIIYHQTEEEGGQDLEFWRGPIKFLEGKCCFPKLSVKKADLKKIVTKCKKVYGDLYDLSRIKSEGYNEKYYIWIGCPKHGWQHVNMYTFQDGSGCPECKKEEHHFKYTTETYIEACKKVHGDKYDLSTIEYHGTENMVTPTCYKHGLFTINAYHFMHGHGCAQCGNDKLSALNRKPLEQYIRECKKVHGDKYIIDETIGYTKAKGTVTPICPIHGRFTTNAGAFLHGYGCAACYGNKPLTNEYFKEKGSKVHKGKYNYEETDISARDEEGRVKIICPIHGEFWQKPEYHLSGRGCKKCGKVLSQSECDIYDYVKSIVEPYKVIHNDRKILGNRRELDIYIPSLKFAIEFEGLVWHSDKFRGNKLSLLEKTLRCDDLGIHLIHIFEDEWLEHPEGVKHKIKNLLKVNRKVSIINEDLCEIKYLKTEEAKDAINTYSIKKYVPHSINIGSYYKNQLVGLMSFSKKKNKSWKFNDYILNPSFEVFDLDSSIFSYFKNKENPSTVEAFVDRRWYLKTNNICNDLGFKYVSFIKPNCYYIKGQKRYNKSEFTKKKIINKYNLSSLPSKEEFLKSKKFNKIWDCGLFKYIWKSSQQN